MTRKHLISAFLVLLLALMSALPALAQSADPETIVDRLLNPRNISFDADGNMYVAEAGNGGEQRSANDDPLGATARVTMVTPEGRASVFLRGLISYRQGNSLGVHDVKVTDDSIWVLLGETSDFSIPFSHALIQLDKENKRIIQWIDLLALELEEAPDGNPNRQSNPMDFEVAPDGTIYIANAGCNCLMSWSEAEGLQVAVVWPFATDNPVPTAVQIDADGNIYVGFLTGFPFPEGGSRVEKWSNGELVQTYEGLTAVTGLLVTDEGEIYAVEHGPQGLQGPGRVVLVTEDGITPVLEGLVSPFGIAQAPDGRIVVSVGSTSGQNGAVIALP